MFSPAISIRLVTAATAHLLDRVDDGVFDHPINPQYLSAFLANSANLLVVASADDVVVGMASGVAYIHPDKPLQLFVNEVGVSPSVQRRGIGKQLVSALLERGRQLGCTEAWVATEKSNVSARALYTALGGKEDKEHAVVYTFSLGG